MTDIDPEKLEEAIKHLTVEGNSDFDWIQVRRSQVAIAVAAAEQTLATLPRYKEVEVEAWAAIYPSGGILDLHTEQPQAAQSLPVGAAERGFGLVRLTGTAKVKVTR